MAIVDADGRLFGRVNLLDALLAVLVAGCLPLAYGAYVLFRVPPPELVSIEPAQLTPGPNLRITVHGVNLRPFLRVSFDTFQGKSFLFSDSTRADVELHEMPPGVYDVVLYDFSQERARLPKALTIRPPSTPLPATKVVVIGRFTNLTTAQAGQVTAGMKLSADDDVIEVGRPGPAMPKVYVGNSAIDVPVPSLLQLPVVLRIGCDVRAPNGPPECYGQGLALRPGNMMAITTPLGPLSFQIDQVHGLLPIESVIAAVRLTGPAELLGRVKKDHVDVTLAGNALAAGATVIAVSPVRRTSDTTAEITAQFRVRSQHMATGWTYDGQPLRMGGPFVFRTPLYELAGIVIGLAPQ